MSSPYIGDHFSMLENDLEAFEIADASHQSISQQAQTAWAKRQERRSILKDTIKQVETTLKSIKSNL